MSAFKLLLQTIRFAGVLSFVALYMGHASLVRIFVRDPWVVKKRLVRIISAYSRMGLTVLGIRVRLDGTLPDLENNNFLIVSNHLSYLDILVVSSVLPSCFVTSVEMKETPLLGQITSLAGCLFVERRNKMNLHQEIGELGEALQRGLSVVVFPEATSTNGEQILRFRRPLFNSALATDTPVLPVCLNYREIKSQPVTKANRDLLFWYGDMPFASHLWDVAGCGEVSVQLSILAPITTETKQEAAEMAAASQAQVEHVYWPVV